MALERLLAHQQDLADRGLLGVLAEERVALRRAVDRGRLEQLPAVQDRLRVDPRRAAAGRADLEAQRRGQPGSALADAPEDRAAADAGAALERLGHELARVQAAAVEHHRAGLGDRELLVAAGRAARAGGRGWRTAAPWPTRCRAARRRRRAGAAWRACAAVATVRDAPGVARDVGRRRGGAPGRGIALGQRELVPLGPALPRERVGLRELAEPGVDVRVAVAVLQLDEVAEPARAADAADAPVLDGDRGRARAAEDPDRAPRAVGLDDVGDVLRPARTRLLALLVGQRAGVGRLGGDREAALRQARERADQVGRQAADHTRAHEHRLDVPVGVVVGEDRAVEVLVGAGGAQVARGGEDAVDRVERVLLAVAVGVDAVHLPGRRA